MQDYYERYRISDYADPSDAILHSIVEKINYKVVFHNHTYYEIFLVYSGAILHEVNGRTFNVNEGSIIFIRPQDTHRYSQLGDQSCSLVRLWASPKIMDSLIAFLGNTLHVNKLLEEEFPVTVSIGKPEMENFVNRFEAVFSLPPEKENQRIASLKQLLMELVLTFTGMYSQVQNQDMPHWLSELCRQISMKENFTAGLKRLFDLSPITREHLSRSFKKYLKTTPTEYITSLRLNYAANQLANTNRKIVDICYDSGFGNLSYFYTCFEKAYGATPKDYRMQKYTKQEQLSQFVDL